MKYLFIIALTFFLTQVFNFYYLFGFALIFCLCFCFFSFIFPERVAFAVGFFLLTQPLLSFLLHIHFPQSMDEILIVLLVLSIFIRKIFMRESFSNSLIYLLLFVIVCLGLVGNIIYQIVPFGVAMGGLFLFLKGFFFFFIFSNIKFKDSDILFYLKGFFIVGVFTAIYGILANFFPQYLLFPLGIDFVGGKYLGIPSLESFLGHPGAFATFMAIQVSFTMAYFLIKRQKKFIFYSIFFLICLIFSFRRTSVLGVVLAFMLVLFIKNFKMYISVSRKVVFFSMLITFVFFFRFLTVMYNNLFVEYFQQGVSPRSALMVTGIRIARDHFPFGSGFGTYAGGINRSFYSPLFYKYRLNKIWGLSEDKPDFSNDTFWPHVLAETGMVGFVLYLIIIIVIFKHIFHSYKSTISDVERIFVLGVFMMFVVSLVDSTKATYYESSIWTYFYFGSIGILVSKFELKDRGKLSLGPILQKK